jgi:ribonuclease P protein subunit RPR2
MKKKYKGSKKQQQKEALLDIKSILLKARSFFTLKKEKSHIYSKKARRISMKYKLKLPSHLNRKICKNCHSFLIPGKNLRVRTTRGHITYYCHECKKFTRIGYK